MLGSLRRRYSWGEWMDICTGQGCSCRRDSASSSGQVLPGAPDVKSLSRRKFFAADGPLRFSLQARNCPEGEDCAFATDALVAQVARLCAGCASNRKACEIGIWTIRCATSAAICARAHIGNPSPASSVREGMSFPERRTVWSSRRECG